MRCSAIEYHPYTLHSRGALNAVSRRREFHGALIRVDGGIGCLHPWPEFGDAPVEDQLKSLRAGGTSKIIERARRMAAVDGEARRRGVALLAGLAVPPSHFSWDQNQPAEPQMERVLAERWMAIKTKGSKDISVTIGELTSLAALAAGERDLAGDIPRFRVDFNSCLTASRFGGFMRALPGPVRERLDFVEDPFPHDPGAWNAARRDFVVRLACDKGIARDGPVPNPGDPGYDVAVLKPGRREWRETLPGIPTSVGIVMTSAMDHAIGQCFAAWEAACAWRELGGRMDFCGLCTEHLFESDPFFERLKSRGGILEADPGGTGLGFDDVIEKLPWQGL